MRGERGGGFEGGSRALLQKAKEVEARESGGCGASPSGCLSKQNESLF